MSGTWLRTWVLSTSRAVVPRFTEKALVVISVHRLRTHAACVAAHTGCVYRRASVCVVSASWTGRRCVHGSGWAVVTYRAGQTLSRERLAMVGLIGASTAGYRSVA